MTFTWHEFDARLVQMGLRQTVYAQGIMTPGTADRLKAFLDEHHAIPGSTIVLNSAGGSLREGLQIGRLIRSHSLDTQVGSSDPKDRSTICMSACTLAFLGGSSRYVPSESRFGVHRFFLPGNKLSGEDAMDSSQVQESEILEYVSYMGVKPGFIVDMNKASPQEINILSQGRMRELNVTTSEYDTNWEIKATPQGDLYVLGTTTDIRGTHKMIVGCPRKSNRSSDTFLMVLYDVGGDSNAALFLSSVALRVNDDFIDLSPEDIVSMPHMAGRYIETDIKLNRHVRTLMAKAHELGLAMLPPSHQTFVGFIGDFQSGKEKVFGFLNSCR